MNAEFQVLLERLQQTQNHLDLSPMANGEALMARAKKLSQKRATIANEGPHIDEIMKNVMAAVSVERFGVESYWDGGHVIGTYYTGARNYFLYMSLSQNASSETTFAFEVYRSPGNMSYLVKYPTEITQIFYEEHVLNGRHSTLNQAVVILFSLSMMEYLLHPWFQEKSQCSDKFQARLIELYKKWDVLRLAQKWLREDW